jgi:hypothetical protein
MNLFNRSAFIRQTNCDSWRYDDKEQKTLKLLTKVGPSTHAKLQSNRRGTYENLMIKFRWCVLGSYNEST